MSRPRRSDAAPVRTGSRERLVDAALRLLSRQGYEATVVKDIAREGAAPMGSFYYHFPGGKEELGEAAMRHGAAQVGRLFASAMDSHDEPARALAACARVLADDLEASRWRDGCPIATAALETVGRSPLLQGAAAEAFTGWQRLIADRLRSRGLPAGPADELAHTAVALIEGAEMLARVHRSREPLDRAGATLHTLARIACDAGDSDTDPHR